MIMRKTIVACLAAGLLCAACHRQQTEVKEAAPQVDTIPVMVMNIQKCSRLYTSEYQVHKIITHDDQMQLKGSFMKKEFSIDLPLGERRVAIPMNATLKAYVDFSHFSEANIKRDGDHITITLPDPSIVLTSTKITHKDVRQYVPLTRRNFTDAELANYEQQGRQSVIEAIPEMGIIENARKSAASTIIPFIVSMGFEEQNITVTFRKEFSMGDIRQLLSTPKQ